MPSLYDISIIGHLYLRVDLEYFSSNKNRRIKAHDDGEQQLPFVYLLAIIYNFAGIIYKRTINVIYICLHEDVSTGHDANEPMSVKEKRMERIVCELL